ncbi:hypothetical protein E2562_011770 [Oryza meyeriana var. granulata]|uniref:Uncharacterized protein n=1 Tax=Oryza meyeriana var. granulata TaxID=110450 RepID=A0A6G1CPE4_9ORYZ|nr:hypothetical protein E2562_011770 [Oryza meyeriana var. granulata]
MPTSAHTEVRAAAFDEHVTVDSQRTAFSSDERASFSATFTDRNAVKRFLSRNGGAGIGSWDDAIQSLIHCSTNSKNEFFHQSSFPPSTDERTSSSATFADRSTVERVGFTPSTDEPAAAFDERDCTTPVSATFANRGTVTTLTKKQRLQALKHHV